VAGTWAELVSIDGTPAARIVAFCQEHYPQRGDLWRKRFGEDLVEVLSAMGHPPGDRVRLELKTLPEGGRRTIELPMTRENRQRIWQRNQAASAPASIVDRFARVSPFAGLKFRGEAIDVQLQADGPWYRLAAVSGVPAERLVAFAKEKFGAAWQKRVAEDLVEVLTGMGVNVGTKVDLAVEDLASKKRVERRDVPLTEENRRRVREMWQKP
jgi:hypothetical protein